MQLDGWVYAFKAKDPNNAFHDIILHVRMLDGKPLQQEAIACTWSKPCLWEPFI